MLTTKSKLTQQKNAEDVVVSLNSNIVTKEQSLENFNMHMNVMVTSFRKEHEPSQDTQSYCGEGAKQKVIGIATLNGKDC